MNTEQLRFRAVLTITRAMLTILDPDSVLQTLVDMIRELEGVIASAVWEYEEANSCLIIRCSSGLSETYVRLGAVPVGAKAVGRAFQRRDLVVISEIDSDPTFAPSLQRVREEGIHTILGAPLVARDRLLGILAVYFPASFSPSESDTDTVRTLANLAALAIDNARLYQGQVQVTKELESLNRLLAEKSEVLSQSLKIHDWLTQTVLVRNGLDAVTDALATFAGTTVVVEDDRLNLLSVSSPESAPLVARHTAEDLGLSRFAGDPRVRQHLSRVAAERQPESLSSIPEIGLSRPRIVAPVLTGDTLMGFVSMIGSDRPFGELDLVLSKQGAVAIALEMTKRKAAFEVEQKIRGNFLRSLLAGELEKLDATTVALGGSGLDLPALQGVLLVRFDQGDAKGTQAGSWAHMPASYSQGYMVVERLVAGPYPKSVLVATKDNLAVLVGSDHKLTDSKIRRLGEQVVSALGEHLAPATVSAGIGRICHHPRDLRRSFVEATKALEVGAVLGRWGGVISFAELGIYGVLLRREDMTDVQEIVGRYVSPLVEYDRLHKTELVQTLSAYVRNNYRLDGTARELFVHSKTVKYRLQKIEKLSGSSLHDSEGLLNLQIALRLHQLTSGADVRYPAAGRAGSAGSV